VVVPATSASAAADGTGWSAYWNYYTPNWMHIQQSPPGATLDAYVSDYNGTRQAQGWLTDNAYDGRCARIKLLSSDIGYFVDRTVCDGGGTIYFEPGSRFSGVLLAVISVEAGGSAVKSFYTYIPASAGDPNLRTVNNGMSWSYYAAFNFQYDVRRAGAHHWGYGGVSGSARWASGTVQSDARGRLRVGPARGGRVHRRFGVRRERVHVVLPDRLPGLDRGRGVPVQPQRRLPVGYIPDPS
jgi:hypothetical protein